MFDSIFSVNIWILVVGYVLFSVLFLYIVLKRIRKFLHAYTDKLTSYRLTVLRITIPKEGQEDSGNKDLSVDQVKERIAVAEVFFSTLGGLTSQKGWHAWWHGRDDHFSLEIVADKEGLVTFYAAVPRTMVQYVEQQIHAQYETAQITEMDDYNIFEAQGAVVGAEVSLAASSVFPIKTYEQMESDPLNAITNILSKFQKEEGAAIQYVVRSANPKWHEGSTEVASAMQQGTSLSKIKAAMKRGPINKFIREIIKAFKTSSNDSNYRLSPSEEELLKAIEEKNSRVGFEVNIRIVVSAASESVAKMKLGNIANAFTQYATTNGNKFTAGSISSSNQLIEDFIYRRFKGKGFIMSTREMASLWHLPLPTTETPNIRWLAARKSAPPSDMPKEGVVLGNVKYRGKETLVRIKRADRRRHMYIIGKSGSGKSVMLTQMAIQDIQNGEGIGVIDPHGDLVEDIASHIPKERADDVVWFDPSDTERPMGLNLLEAENDDERDYAAGEMIAIFYKLFGEEMIGPMFEHYMRNTMLALMEDKESGATLIEIPRMLTDDKFRKEKLKKVKNMIVKNFWEQEYEQSQQGQQAADMLSYVISKIGRFLTNNTMRNIVGQSKSAFDIADVMNNQKILLVNLSKGKIGDLNSSLLGLIMVTKIQMAAMRRQDIPKPLRKDFYLYMDEFQNFSTDSIAVILSEARKYLLDLIMAHQYVGQLAENNDTTIRDAVFGNAGTMVSFRVGAEDAEVLEKEFSPVFNQNDIINVEKFTANIKLLIDGTASRPFNMGTILPPDGNVKMMKALKELSRLKYGRAREEVEAEIKSRAKWDDLGGKAPNTPDSFF